MTTYTFSVPTAEFNIETGQPKREKWVRRCDSDAQAELWARRISEDKRGVSVRVHRPGADWSVSCGFVPT
jgi:hypothetical protein